MVLITLRAGHDTIAQHYATAIILTRMNHTPWAKQKSKQEMRSRGRPESLPVRAVRTGASTANAALCTPQ